MNVGELNTDMLERSLVIFVGLEEKVPEEDRDKAIDALLASHGEAGHLVALGCSIAYNLVAAYKFSEEKKEGPHAR